MKHLSGTVITSKTTSSLKVAAKNFASKYPQIDGKVSGAIVLSINEKFGKGTYFDGRGAYNGAWSGGMNQQINAGKTILKIKPDHWKIPSSEEVEISFFAEDSHQYSISSLISLKGLEFHWMPFVYDLTTDTVVNISNQQPRSVMSLDEGRGFIPGVYTSDGVYLPGS